ncbi:nuclease-related domain-containing protein [Leptolyngbya sp. FACHB-261]|uniref:nuclease-related domain-containing protein n=1 Tax=Leptolyngbya sp. FACHB-261 TaxID=2692806 RepID=UPI001687E5A0|nr:nuclease-related domain-containing protein [Leptolyngbya sp. FACHB-261]MBD2102814.1 NERD domain-containing protein [Leptolyngbya sp. FACHB-261]
MLALQRRLKAFYAFGGAIVFAGAPFYLASLHLVAISSALYWGGFALAGLCVLTGLNLWQKADRADQGARGEEAVALVLDTLRTKGWTVEYGLRVKGVGDVDAFLQSPRGNAYVVEVKSHGGQVLSDGQSLYRRLRSGHQPFEKDFLNQAMQQALTLKREKQLRFVTPLVVFSRATVSAPHKLRGVHVLGKAEVVKYLQRLDAQ